MRFVYVWEDKTSGKVLEILKELELYKEPPTLNEAKDCGMEEEEYKKAVWVKRVGSKNQIIRGFGQKGYW